MENTPPEAICVSRAEGCKLPRGAYFPIHPDSRSFFFPERKCVGNYPSSSQVVLTVYKFNTLPLHKKRMVVAEEEEQWEI